MNKIYIYNYPKYFLNTKILYNYILYKPSISYHKINSHKKQKLFDFRRFYDYVNKLRVFSVSKHNGTDFFLDLEFNPVIKSIYISQYKTLSIPKDFLLNLFQSQLGLPKNYYRINYIIRRIKLWYKLHGFLWVEVKFVKHVDSSNISIKINEGKIKETTLICQSQNGIDKDYYNKINSLVKRELNVLPGSLLNSQDIERAIERLKKYQYISRCYYNVLKHKNGVYVTIKYSLPSHKLVGCLTKQQLVYPNIIWAQYPYLNSIYSLWSMYYYNSYYPIPKLSHYKKYISLRNVKNTYLYFEELEFYHNQYFTDRTNYIYIPMTSRFRLASICNRLLKVIIKVELKKKFINCANMLQKLSFAYNNFYNINLNLIHIKLDKNKHLFSAFNSLQVYIIKLCFHYKLNKPYILKSIRGNHSLNINFNFSMSILKDIINHLYNLFYLNQCLESRYKNTVHIQKAFSWIQNHNFIFLLQNNLFLADYKKMRIDIISILKLEYNISIIDYTWLYCLVNLLVYSNINNLNISSFSLLRETDIANYQNYVNNCINLGLQLDSFIKDIPSIRLEFIFHYKKCNIIHIYTSRIQ